MSTNALIVPTVESFVSLKNKDGVENGFRLLRASEFKKSLSKEMAASEKRKAYSEYIANAKKANKVLALSIASDRLLVSAQKTNAGATLKFLDVDPEIKVGGRKKGAATEEEAAAVMADATKIPVDECLRIIRENAEAFKPVDIASEVKEIASEVKSEQPVDIASEVKEIASEVKSEQPVTA